jgi:hypothetical protein
MGALVQCVCVLPSSGQPGGDGGLSKAEHTLSSGWVQPFGKGREHHCDLLGGGFQSVERGMAPGSEGGAACLAAKRLYLLSMAMLAIPNQRVNVSIADSEVRAQLVGTGVALGIYALGCSPPASDLAPGAHRCRYWPSSRRASGGESTGGASVWASGLEQTVKRAALGPPLGEAGRRWSQSRHQSSVRERRRQTTSKNTKI